ncbi:biotin/lipoyl-containing protein [Marmoricola sp. RAF53]|uniref:biotin/lipoyl-containing protein n=1 Tax=Marmoricola sp. RAF53 TaxID=3233059 RepID=UPI003F948585
MSNVVVADCSGVVLQVLVSPGDVVTVGQAVVVLEAMKMELPVEADGDGAVGVVHVVVGRAVAEGDPLVTLT